MRLLQDIIDILVIPANLPKQNRAHTLKGDYADKNECHILADWLLIYKVIDGQLILYRTGTHSDLFKE